MGWMSSLMGLLYVAAGGVKTVVVHEGVYQKLKAAFREFATVFPLRPLGYTPEPNAYMQTVGIIEVALGALLLLGPPSAKRISCYGLMTIMIGSVQTLLCLGKYTDAVLPALLFCVLYWISGHCEPVVKRD